MGESAKGDVIVRRPSPRQSGRPRRNFLHLVPLGLLFLAVAGIFTADALAPSRRGEEFLVDRKAAEAPSYKVDIGKEEIVTVNFRAVDYKIEDEPEENVPKPAVPVKVEIRDEPADIISGYDGFPIDPQPLVTFMHNNGKWYNNNRPSSSNFGVSTLPAGGAGTGKRLTYAVDGSSNYTLVSINSAMQAFGNTITGKRYFPDFAKAKPRPANPLRSDEYWGVGANFQGKGGILFHEILEVVPGRQPALVKGKLCRQLDTVLARYIIHNQTNMPHRVGMRFMIDTLIGTNDGVPFTVPGLPGLVDTCRDFKNSGEVPDFIQALENPDLRDPGTVAHMTLRLGRSIEPPSRVSITRWPGPQVANWEVPVIPMKERRGGTDSGDSAVILYWNEKELKPNEKREIGYAYGLGSVASTDTAGSLGITLGGSFEPGQSFTITAYVRRPVANQTLTLELPDGLERLTGDSVVKAPAPITDPTWIVTWKVKVLRTGEFPIRVQSSTGITQSKTISIAARARADGREIPPEVGAAVRAGQGVPGGRSCRRAGAATNPVVESSAGFGEHGSD